MDLDFFNNKSKEIMIDKGDMKIENQENINAEPLKSSIQLV